MTWWLDRPRAPGGASFDDRAGTGDDRSIVSL
jgi:hypothetical protein